MKKSFIYFQWEKTPFYTNHTIYEREHIMSKLLFNEQQRRQNLKRPVQIFKKAGINMEIIGIKKAQRNGKADELYHK